MDVLTKSDTRALWHRGVSPCSPKSPQNKRPKYHLNLLKIWISENLLLRSFIYTLLNARFIKKKTCNYNYIFYGKQVCDVTPTAWCWSFQGHMALGHIQVQRWMTWVVLITIFPIWIRITNYLQLRRQLALMFECCINSVLFASCIHACTWRIMSSAPSWLRGCTSVIEIPLHFEFSGELNLATVDPNSLHKQALLINITKGLLLSPFSRLD